ncbi:MAG TPA: prepilin peptidase [Acidobacteriaceae bacterium]|nr:prepilin peptidase [Acidobacteriaceae bacterium]
MIFCIFFALLGLLVGSFLNVCIVRLPVGESVVWPRSHCRQCDHPIASWDNIPVLSWILLGASCRACGNRISWRYPLIESATCLLFLMCCLRFGFGWIAGGWALLCFLLLGLAVMDAETLLLPDRFTLPGLVAGVLFSGLRPGLGDGVWSWSTAFRSAGFAILAAGIAATLLLLIAGVYWLARRRMGMGLGDVKLLAMLASWLGLRQTGLVLFIAVIGGALYGVGTIVLNRRQKRSDPLPPGLLPVPFGTMLSLAGLYSVFLGERTLDWYLQFFH